MIRRDKPVSESKTGTGSRLWGYLQMERARGSIDALDGLRGIAILLVLLRHAVYPIFAKEDSLLPIFGWDMKTFFANGWIGVDLFFVLSGFLISNHILRRWHKEFRWSDVRSYVYKRALRIFPAYYVFMLLVAFGAFPFYETYLPATPTVVAYHLLYLQDYLPSSIVVSFWSLGVEEKFYIVVPFLLVPLMRTKEPKRALGWLAALISIPVMLRFSTFLKTPGLDTYPEFFRIIRSPFHLSLDSLLIGTCCGFLFYHREHFTGLSESTAWTKKAFWAGVGMIALLAIPSEILGTIELIDVTVFTFLGIGFGLILLALVFNQTLYSGFFGNSFLFFFSKISYSLYLVHLIFVNVTYDQLCTMPGFTSLSAGTQFLVYVPTFTMVSVAGALALHYLVEKPFLILKDRI